MRVYYELVLWEEVDNQDTEILKGKMGEMAKRFAGFGCLSFIMRGQQAQAQAQTIEQPPSTSPQYQPQPEPQQEEVIDE